MEKRYFLFDVSTVSASGWFISAAVYPATREEKEDPQLRSSDLSPIRYKKVAEADSKGVRLPKL